MAPEAGSLSRDPHRGLTANPVAARCGVTPLEQAELSLDVPALVPCPGCRGELDAEVGCTTCLGEGYVVLPPGAMVSDYLPDDDPMLPVSGAVEPGLVLQGADSKLHGPGQAADRELLEMRRGDLREEIGLLGGQGRSAEELYQDAEGGMWVVAYGVIALGLLVLGTLGLPELSAVGFCVALLMVARAGRRRERCGGAR